MSGQPRYLSVQKLSWPDTLSVQVFGIITACVVGNLSYNLESRDGGDIGGEGIQ